MGNPRCKPLAENLDVLPSFWVCLQLSRSGSELLKGTVNYVLDISPRQTKMPATDHASNGAPPGDEGDNQLGVRLLVHRGPWETMPAWGTARSRISSREILQKRNLV